MSIHHSAYLFDTDKFRSVIAPYSTASPADKDVLCGELREKAIAAFKRNSLVRELSLHCGAWDEASLFGEPVSRSKDIEFAFWVMLLMYDCLKTHPAPLGLESDLTRFERILIDSGISKENVRTLLSGHRFTRFAQLNFEQLADYWQYVNPFGTSSSAGWIPHVEAVQQLDVLTHYRHQVAESVRTSPSKKHSEQTDRFFSKLLQMYQVAFERKTDMCIIECG